MNGMSQSFTDKLAARIRKTGSALCVGLDPRPVMDDLQSVPSLLRKVVEETAPYAAAFKPNIAYFEAMGLRGLEMLEELLPDMPKDVPVVLDAKRGDIGSTAEHYAREAFERYDADCVTLSPFMGFDTIQPYLSYADRGAFVLCRTSNKGGDDFQMLEVSGEKIYERIARLAATEWNVSGQLGLVVGATYPNELANVRRIAPDLPLLVPGIGAQGGDDR